MADKQAIQHLNLALKNELTAINQYFLHARMLRHQGYKKLEDKVYEESIDEMKHADQLINRILLLGGFPNLQDLGKLFIGETPEEMLKCDLKLEQIAIPALREAIVYLESTKDFASADLLHEILRAEEEHQLWIETQLRLIEKLGAAAYLQTQV